jgi:hypothetical protein
VAVAGGGPAYDECGRNGAVIDDLLYDYVTSAIVSSSPVAPNPQGVARLAGLVETAALPDDGPPQTTPPLPTTASNITGMVFEMEANPVLLEWFSLSFPGGSEALLEYRTTETVTTRVGLDDMFRVSPGELGLPFAAKGWWVDDNRFAMLLDQVPLFRYLDLEFLFEGSSVTITLEDIACGDPPLTMTGHAQPQE